VVFNDIAFPVELYGADLGQFAGVKFTLCSIFLGGHIWHALKSKSETGILTEEDQFRATMVGFLVLEIAVISLVLLTFKP
jgi:photosystem II CP43 chlorophyll apoprotein